MVVILQIFGSERVKQDVPVFCFSCSCRIFMASHKVLEANCQCPQPSHFYFPPMVKLSHSGLEGGHDFINE